MSSSTSSIRSDITKSESSETMNSAKPVSIVTSTAGSTCSSSSNTTSCITLSTQITTKQSEISEMPSETSHSATLSNQTRYQRHILSLTNALRTAHSAPTVTLNTTLNEVARLHNLDVAKNMGELSHVSSDGRTLTERLLDREYDFRYASENLARGQRDCKWVMNSWMKSPGHRRNVLNERVREMGLSVGVWQGRMYWCQVFGVRRR